MTVRDIVMSAAGGSSSPLSVDDVFSSYTYFAEDLPTVGNKFINNGINLSQNTTTEWKTYEFAGDIPTSLYIGFSRSVVDSNGDIYAVGRKGFSNFHVTKFNSSFQIIWSKTYSSSNAVTCDNIYLDASGNLYVTGNISPSIGGLNGYVAKLNPSGTILWSSGLGSTISASFNEYIQSLDVDSSGNVYVGGYRQEDATGYTASYVTKINSSGTTVWSRLITDSDNFATFQGMGVDSSGNCYIGSDSRVIKLDSSGTVVWKVSLTAPNFYYGQKLLYNKTTDELFSCGFIDYNSNIKQAVVRLNPSTGALVNQIVLSGLYLDDAIIGSDNSIYTADSGTSGTIITKFNIGSGGLTLAWAKNFRYSKNNTFAAPNAVKLFTSSTKIYTILGGLGYNGVIVSLATTGTDNTGEAGNVFLSTHTHTNQTVSFPVSSATTTALTVASFTGTNTYSLTTTSADSVDFYPLIKEYIQPAITSTGSGLVWIKYVDGTGNNALLDTVRPSGNQVALSTDLQGVGSGGNNIEFTASGFRISTSSFNLINDNAALGNSAKYFSWTFKEAPKFFDIVTYTGNGTIQTIPHNLGIAPGFILFKNITTNAAWVVYHRSTTPSGTSYITPGTGVQTSSTIFNSVAPTTNNFSVGSGVLNTSGYSYVAYVFAHDDSQDSVIKCGSYSGSTNNFTSVSLGWEPQWLMILDPVAGLNSGIFHTGAAIPKSKTFLNDYTAQSTRPFNSASATAVHLINTNSSGFDLYSSTLNITNQTCYYVAIKKGIPKTFKNTDVFGVLQYTGEGISKNVSTLNELVNYDTCIISYVSTGSTNARPPTIFSNYEARYSTQAIYGTPLGTTEAIANTPNTYVLFGLGADSLLLGSSHVFNHPSSNYNCYLFKRAETFYDITAVEQIGNTALHPVQTNHSLNGTPKLIIAYDRYNPSSKYVYHTSLGTNNYILLDTNAGSVSSTNFWGTVASTTFGLSVLPAGASPICHLFAETPGISKISSYTGNGTTQTIDCGFTQGARFVMIKRTDATGNWYIWDSVSGIISSSELSKVVSGSSAAVVSDSLDPATSGFVVNQNTTTNINVSSATYIYMAIA
jgi:hypothetical protein